MTVSLRGNREVKANCQIFHLIGQLDAFSEGAFSKEVEASIKKPSNIILDLSKIDFIDSSGIGAMVKVAKKIKEAGGTLQIVANQRVTQTVKLVRLEKFLALQPSMEAAIANVSPK